MVTLYPDTIAYWVQGEPIRDAYGHYVTEGSEGSYNDMGACRLEYNAPSAASDKFDKIMLATNATIYAPLSIAALPDRGQKVKVTKGYDGTEHELTVVNSERGLLHVRIWVD